MAGLRSDDDMRANKQISKVKFRDLMNQTTSSMSALVDGRVIVEGTG